MDPHRLAELRSLAYHQQIAQRLLADDTLLARALARTRQWQADGGPTHSTWASAWEQLLGRPLDEVIERLGADDEEMRALRQSTPFAGALDPRERWRLHRQVRTENGGPR